MSQIKTFGSHLVDFGIIPPHGVFIDAGACVGNFIDDVLENATSPHIFALEPNRDNHRVLRINYGEYSRLCSKEAALVGSTEPANMRFAQFEGLPEWGNVTGLYGNRKHKFYDVETINIDTLLDHIRTCPAVKGPLLIHHLKMDIEGCEHGVIADMTIEHAKCIQQISLEVHNGIQGMLEHLTEIGYDAKFEKGELYAISRFKKIINSL